jgi:quinol monooxygenase YgiN
MIHVTTRMKVSAENLEGVISSIRGLLEPTRTRSGCLGFRLLQEVTDTSNLVIEEQWASREAFERHVRSAAYRTVLETIEAACEPPSVEIHNVPSSQGMEVVHSILQSTHSKGG